MKAVLIHISLKFKFYWIKMLKQMLCSISNYQIFLLFLDIILSYQAKFKGFYLYFLSFYNKNKF